MEDLALMKNMLALVGTVEMIKHFDKQKKVPGFVWVLLTAVLGTLSVLPFVPDWVLDAALVVSVSTLFYDHILQRLKKSFEKVGGDNE